MRAILAFLTVFVAWATPVWAEEDADPPPPASFVELEARLADILAESDVVGAQAAIIGVDGVQWAGAFGLADRDANRPVMNDTVFRAGSISKTFTALAAMKLVEEERLDLGDRLADLAPEVAFQNGWEADHPVLLVHLLEHTAGWDDIHISEYAVSDPDITPLEGLAVNPISRTSRWRPGLYASYANSGAGVVGYVIEKTSGRASEDYIESEIMDALGIEGASFFLTDDIAERIAKSYAAGEPHPYHHIIIRPAGALNISASELGKLVQFFLNDGRVGDTQLLQPETIQRIETPHTSKAAQAGLDSGYGLGNFTTYLGGEPFHGHAGGIDGFIADFGYRQDAGLGFVLMLNTQDGAAFVKLRETLAAYISTQAPPSPRAQPVETDTSAFAGFYRQHTPRSEIARLFTNLIDIQIVGATETGLRIKPLIGGEFQTFLPTGANLFRHDDHATPNMVLLENADGGHDMIYRFQSAYKQVSTFDAYWPLALVAAAGLFSATALLSMLIWCVGRPFGAFADSNRWRVWAGPMLSIAAAGLIVGLMTIAMQKPGYLLFETLGTLSATALTIQFASIAFAGFAGLGVLSALFGLGANGFSRLHAGLASLALAGFAAYAANYGWIGVTTWSYAPKIVGG